MESWTNKWIGRKWSPDYDCSAFVLDVLQRDLGLDYEFPRMDWRRTQPTDVMGLSGEFASRVEAPRDYDGVLMRCVRGSHIGLYAGGAVLHNTEALGSVLTPVERLFMLGLEVVGYYRWK